MTQTLTLGQELEAIHRLAELFGDDDVLTESELLRRAQRAGVLYGTPEGLRALLRRMGVAVLGDRLCWRKHLDAA